MSKPKVKQQPSTTKKPSRSKQASVSICIPSSVISSKNAYNLQQQTSIVYQIVKACTIYNVSEVIILNIPDINEEKQENVEQTINGNKKVVFNGEKVETKLETKKSTLNDDTLLLASLLQFFITPPYLIKTMFSNKSNSNFTKILPKFKYALKLPKITTLPFMQNNEVYKNFKEGLIIAKKTPKIKKKNEIIKPERKLTVSKYVNIGESKPIKLNIKREIPIYSRVTIDIKNKTIVSPIEAYGYNGYKSSFGYNVRIVDEFNKLFTQSPIKEGYSKTLFINCDDYFENKNNRTKINELDEFNCQEFKNKTITTTNDNKNNNDNLLLLIGNLNDFEINFNNDSSTMFKDLNIVQLIDNKLTIPKGCKIEDGLLICLTRLLL
ncbi:unnamed protein product [Candida verbasci]|uniref:Methyltransferase n=1 Tax=Candida verbasci TaxID=1227364 RepID=A0A9W4TYQ8_9ASCO|nr:unnamed protein product [Candida verbasci]